MLISSIKLTQDVVFQIFFLSEKCWVALLLSRGVVPFLLCIGETGLSLHEKAL